MLHDDLLGAACVSHSAANLWPLMFVFRLRDSQVSQSVLRILSAFVALEKGVTYQTVQDKEQKKSLQLQYSLKA